MSEKYIDPSNYSDIIAKLENLSDKKDVQNLIENTFPNWLRGSTNHYCQDYPHLQLNWEYICRSLNVSPKKIIFVDFIDFENDSNKTIQSFGEKMTRSGYMVRRVGEFVCCSNCSAAIPDKEIWEKFREMKIQCPEIWSDKCSSC